MRPLIAALALLPTLAFAADPNALAEKEARQFLRPCQPGETQQLCLIHQRNFIEQYVYAKSGEKGGQSSTADSFDTHHLMTEPSLSIGLGMPQNQIQSCAWRVVIVQYGHSDIWAADTGMVRSACGTLDQTGQAIALRRADELLRELRTNPARMPSLDWEPKVTGLAPSPPVKGPGRIIDVTQDPPKPPSSRR